MARTALVKMAHQQPETAIVTELAKLVASRIDAILRYLVLNYQLNIVEKTIELLDRQERRQLVELANRKTHSVEHATRSSNEAFARIKSTNSYMRVMALAQWLAIAYLETRGSGNADMTAVHRKLMRTFRNLRESVQPIARAA